MPTVRYLIRNEYGLADPEVYWAADKYDPEALLEGVAMAGLVGVLRQLGDLAEFAAEVFHDLHEEVMATSARGHGLTLRVQQLEVEFPSIEKVLLSQSDYSSCAYSSGIDWHANIRVDQNLFTQGDMPRFILDSYEECRGPPRLFMLDKFDVAGAGACLTRYSDPSIFKRASASEMMKSELQREKRARKLKKKGSGWRSGEMANSFFTPIIANSHHIASEPVPEKFPTRHVRLKHRNLRSSDITNRKSYMECFLEEELLEQNDIRSSLSASHIKTNIDWDSEVEKVLVSSTTDSSLVRKEVYPLSPKDEAAKLENQKAEGREFAEIISVLSGGSQQLYPNSQNAKQAVLVGLVNRMGKHAFELRSDKNDTMPPALQLAENNFFADSGLVTDDGHGGYGSDDVGSELENYVDAFNTMESEIETDSESRVKSDAGLFNSESQRINLGINEHLELQPEFLGLGFAESFDTSEYTENMKDGTPILSRSTTLVDLHYPQLQKRTVAEATSCLEINKVVTGELERTGEALKLISPAYSTFNGTCYEQQLNATIFTSISEEASSNFFITALALNSKQNFEEVQSLTVPSAEAFFGNTESAPDVNQSIESSFLPWKENHVIFPTYKESLDIPSDIIEEINSTTHSEDRISATITDKNDMPCDISEAEHGILPEKVPAEYLKGSPLTMMCDEIGKPLEMLEHDTNDCISGSISPNIPMGTFVWEPLYLSNELEVNMQTEDLAKKTSSKYIDGSDAASKQLDSSLQFPAETHELPLISISIVSHESTQNFENVYDSLEHLSDERGSPQGSRDYLMKDQFSGDTEKIMANDMATIFQISEPPQTPAESSSQEVCSVYVKDSLHNSMEKENETYSVVKLSPTSSAFSLEIVSSILQSESLDVETRNIYTPEEELVLPQSPASSGNVDIVKQKTSKFPYITNEFEHLSDAEEPQQFANICTREPPPSDCGEDPGVNPFQPVVSELIETNGKEHSTYSLELANGSTKLNLQFDQLRLEESAKEDDSLAGNVITKDCMDVQVLHMVQSAKVYSFDVHLQEEPILEKDTYNPKPSIEEPAITIDSTSLQPGNKSVMPFAQNKDLEIFVNTVSRSHSSVLDLSDSSYAKLVGLNVDNLRAEFPPNLDGDKICSRENEYASDLEFENFITEDVLSLLQSSNVYSLDVPLQKGAFSEDAALNQCKPDVEELAADSESKSENVITQDGTDDQVLSLLQSSFVSSFVAQFQEDPVLEDASLNQLMLEIEEPAMKSELTSLMFASKLSAPFTKNGDQKESVCAISSSQLLALDSSNFTDDQLADDTFDDIHMELDHGIYEENFMYSRDDEQDTNSKDSVLHFQADVDQSEQTSVAKAVDEPSTIHSHGGGENIEPSDTYFYEVCSDERTNIQNSLELEVLLPELEHETLLKHGRDNELNMPSSKIDEREEIKTDPSVVSPCVFEHTGSSSASETLASRSPFVADFIVPTSITSIEEPLPAFSGEVISSSQLKKDVAEAPPLPPLPPLQWRMGKPQLGYLFAGEHMTCVMETNPITLPSNAGSIHINFSTPSKDEIDQHTIPFLSLSALEERVQHVSMSTDGHMTESLKWSELPPITMDQRQEFEIQFPDFKKFQSSDLSLIVSSKEDDKHLHGNIATEAENLFTIAPSLKDVNLQHPDLFEEGKRQAVEDSRPMLCKLLPGLELERSQDAPVMDGNATLALSSFLFMPTEGDGKYQYAYGDYEGEIMRHHNLSAPFPVAVHSVPHYGYHMFLREGDSSIYDIILPEMEDDKPNGKPLFIRNRPRDPLIEAVAAHDKSTLRKVSELDRPSEDERNYLLEQIKNRSFNLKPVAAAKPNLIKASSTNLKVAAILEKANAIRQACVGSDEDEDNNWSDS